MLSLHFEQPQVRIDNSVWVWLTKEKLDRMKLSTESVVDTCQVSVETFSGKSRLLVQHSDDAAASKIGTVVHNVNTAKEFKEFNRSSMFGGMVESCRHVDFKERVYLVTFADLKSYVFTYNVAVPSLSPLDFSYECGSMESVVRTDDSQEVLVRNSEGLLRVCDSDLSAVRAGETILVPSDHLEYSVRTLLTRICMHIAAPIVVNIETRKARWVGVLLQPISTCRVVFGWTKWSTETGLLTTIQSVDLKRFMDPATIAREAVSLNVKLIKWRLIPGIEPEKMTSLRFLLLGAGTLGCSVARCLLAWGVENITLVDSGTVSYSNLARQWLFRLEDAKNNAPKALIAAERLREILPSVNSVGVQLAIPLPGHPEDVSNLSDNFAQLQSLISQADVVFMLTDSRESRWLPSLMVAAENTQNNSCLGISVALGFDSYLVKTHSAPSACYFCNDLSAPSSNTSFRTLDQQCTVTRPGVAAIAACVAVELVANLTQSNSLLGATPDQVRGFLGSFTSFPAVTERCPNCVCCSNMVINAYLENRLEFVERVVLDAGVLMEVSGMDLELRKMEHHELNQFVYSSEDE